MVAEKMEFSQLEPGYEFPPHHYRLNSSAVSSYLKAVGDTTEVYQGSGLVPPLAVAALALSALSQGINLPPGTIHVSQEFEFSGTATIDDSLTSFARISRKHNRGNLQLMAIDFKVKNQSQQVILTARTSFILPQNSKSQAE